MLESVAGEGMTMMLVTHEMNFARNVADRVIFMHEGRIHEDGPARETLLEPRTAELQELPQRRPALTSCNDQPTGGMT